MLIAVLPARNKPQPHESLAQECLPEVGICPHKTHTAECIMQLEFALRAEVIGQCVALTPSKHAQFWNGTIKIFT